TAPSPTCTSRRRSDCGFSCRDRPTMPPPASTKSPAARGFFWVLPPAAGTRAPSPGTRDRQELQALSIVIPSAARDRLGEQKQILRCARDDRPLTTNPG